MVYKRTLSDTIFHIVMAIVMIVVALIMVYPFLYIINYSLSKQPTGILLWPKGFTLDSYTQLFRDSDLVHAFFISVARSLIGPVLTLVVTGMAAYVLAIPNLVFGKFIRTFFVMAMYVGAGTIPTYIFMQKYHLRNTFWVYIIPSLCAVFYMILIKTYIESLSTALIEAVRVDGGNDLQCYWRVIFPLCKPVNAAVLLYCIIGQWNSMMDTALYCAMEENLHTLQYLLYNLLATQTSLEALKDGMIKVNPQSIKMAVTVITVLPIMCVYPFLQKYFVSGLMMGSVKA